VSRVSLVDKKPSGKSVAARVISLVILRNIALARKAPFAIRVFPNVDEIGFRNASGQGVCELQKRRHLASRDGLPQCLVITSESFHDLGELIERPRDHDAPPRSV
jgi:hypothetical protein